MFSTPTGIAALIVCCLGFIIGGLLTLFHLNNHHKSPETFIMTVSLIVIFFIGGIDPWAIVLSLSLFIFASIMAFRGDKKFLLGFVYTLAYFLISISISIFLCFPAALIIAFCF